MSAAPPPVPGLARTAPPTFPHLPPDQRSVSMTDVRAGFARYHRRVERPELVPSRHAGVLIPLVERDGEPYVFLIERSGEIGTHRGDIAFPGGTVNAGESPADAALRETYEEIGLPPSEVEVIAALDNHPILTGFVIWPFVGLLTGAATPRPMSPEVARTLVVPLSALTADGNFWQEDWPGRPGAMLPFFTVPGGVAWGTTGQLLVEVIEVSLAGRAAREAASPAQEGRF